MDIPEILVVLKRLILQNNGLIQEGIFRKSGNEMEMQKIIKNYDSGLPIICSNSHSLASILKVFFPSHFLISFQVF